jgi:hypothetical protein
MPHSSVVDRPSLPALLTATSSQPKRFDGRIDERTHIVLVARIGAHEWCLAALSRRPVKPTRGTSTTTYEL